MPASQELTRARASTRTEGSVLEVALEGPWRLDGETPRWGPLVGKDRPQEVRLRADGVTRWDTSLVAFVGEAQHWCAEAGVACDTAPLPEKMRLLGGQFAESLRASTRVDHTRSLLEGVGISTREAMSQGRDFLQFVGECWIIASRDEPGARLPPVRRGMLDRHQEARCGAGRLPLA